MTKKFIIITSLTSSFIIYTNSAFTNSETYLLYDSKFSTMKDKMRVAAVIAHEQGHQWFGDYVTLSWWNNVWLNEGFASYFEYHAMGRMKNPDDPNNLGKKLMDKVN